MGDIQERLSVSSSSSSSTTCSLSVTTAQPKADSLPIDGEFWMIAEERAHEILNTIQPAIISDRSRNEIIDYVHTLIKSHDGIEVRLPSLVKTLALLSFVCVCSFSNNEFVSTGIFIWFGAVKNLSPRRRYRSDGPN